MSPGLLYLVFPAYENGHINLIKSFEGLSKITSINGGLFLCLGIKKINLPETGIMHCKLMSTTGQIGWIRVVLGSPNPYYLIKRVD